jgi:hypothetical protein
MVLFKFSLVVAVIIAGNQNRLVVTDVRGHVNVKAGSRLGGNLLAERNFSLS